ncbi:hypothetical protein EDB85DRAFT_1904906 [Lactarius pseudohatsudake]|nr:hypothetical protein EDB85DRAFT_1904906 [Lactarius pseudohatsudake]
MGLRVAGRRGVGGGSGGGWAEVMTWHTGLHVVVVLGQVDSRGVLCAVGWRGSGVAQRVTGLRSRVGMGGWWLQGFAHGIGVTLRWGFCAGGVGGDALEWGICMAGYWWRLRETRPQVQLIVVSWGLACRDGMALGAGVLVEVEGDGATSLGVARQLGSPSGDVVCEKRYRKKKKCILELGRSRACTSQRHGGGAFNTAEANGGGELEQRWQQGLWADVLWQGGGGDAQ